MIQMKHLTNEDIKQVLFDRDINSNKSDFGYIAIVGGSMKYSGAIQLATLGNTAMRSGSGVVKIATSKNLYEIIAKNILECTFFPLSSEGYDFIFVKDEFIELIENVKVVAIGMGIGNTDQTKKAIQFLINEYDGILLIDADGINALAELDKNLLLNDKSKIVLTPHIKEFHRLACMKDNITYEELKNNQIDLLIDFAKYFNVNILLKGHTNYITNGEEIYEVTKGSQGMATAGSGDVLSGIMSAILGYNNDNILKAMAVSVYVNGLAGEIAMSKETDITMIASDTANNVKEAIKQIKKDYKEGA